MDFTGLGRFTAYKLDRPLTEEEKAQQLDPKRQSGQESEDFLSVIEINGRYLELADRWYGVKGFSVWLGLLFTALLLVFLFAVLHLSFFCSECRENNTSDMPIWVLAAIGVPLLLPMLFVSLYGLRLEAFRRTHYPIRLNRSTRQVHAMRPDGTVLTVPWDKLFLCIGESSLPLAERSVDIRAHVLDADGETVRETFTLGYVPFAEREDLLKLWEYIRRYMETPDGAERNFRKTKFFLPIAGRREGLFFGLLRSFSSFGRMPALQFIASPILALNTWGRWIAMYTSKVPRWPAEIEAKNVVTPDDPYRKDWRSNGPYQLGEWLWSVICFMIGTGVVVWVFYKLFGAMAE